MNSAVLANRSYTGRTIITAGAIAAGLVLVGGRLPIVAYGTLILALLYLLLVNARAADDLIRYLFPEGAAGAGTGGGGGKALIR